LRAFGSACIEADAGDPKRWLSAGASFEGADSCNKLPTAERSIPRNAPPFRPAGVEPCEDDALARWIEDDFCVAPYQYRKANCIVDPSGELRRASASEKEVLMGFPL
jgi:hypothetical protein